MPHKQRKCQHILSLLEYRNKLRMCNEHKYNCDFNNSYHKQGSILHMGMVMLSIRNHISVNRVIGQWVNTIESIGQ